MEIKMMCDLQNFYIFSIVDDPALHFSFASKMKQMIDDIIFFIV
jgi:hypothetical protein